MDEQTPVIPSTTVVIPCYNEAERLDRAELIRWTEAHPWASLMLVDDGSTDATATVLTELSEHDRIDCLLLKPNGGKGEAVRKGLAHVMATTDAAFVAYWDADLATPLDEVVRFAEHLRDHPDLRLVMGSRVKLLGVDVERDPIRHYLGRIAATLTSTVLGLPVYDTQCGAKMLRTDGPAKDLVATPFMTRWMFDVELIIRLLGQHPQCTRREFENHVHELALPRWHDVPSTRVTLRDTLRAPFDLIRIWLRTRPDRLGR